MAGPVLSGARRTKVRVADRLTREGRHFTASRVRSMGDAEFARAAEDLLVRFE